VLPVPTTSNTTKKSKQSKRLTKSQKGSATVKALKGIKSRQIKQKKNVDKARKFTKLVAKHSKGLECHVSGHWRCFVDPESMIHIPLTHRLITVWVKMHVSQANFTLPDLFNLCCDSRARTRRSIHSRTFRTINLLIWHVVYIRVVIGQLAKSLRIKSKRRSPSLAARLPTLSLSTIHSQTYSSQMSSHVLRLSLIFRRTRMTRCIRSWRI
jgi:hypothetical protein